jgi:Coenzyme PQQ synthesis protein D (PqqD)
MARRVQHPDVVYTALEDDAVLLNLETGSYYSLNEVGTAIWQLLDSTASDEDLVDRLTAEYEVERERAQSSVSTFLQELERAQLVVPDREGRATGGERNPGESAEAQAPPAERKPFAQPELLKHDEPLHEVVMNPFDPQLPLAE